MSAVNGLPTMAEAEQHCSMGYALKLNGKHAHGRVTLVDEDVWVWAQHLYWCVSTNGYVSTRSGGTTALLHRMIMNPPKGMDVDHIDLDKMDNRRCSLRIVTRGQNAQNRPKRSGTTSKYIGVSKKKTRWKASIRLDYVQYELGSFATEAAAAVAYDTHAIKFFGRGARLNFPGGDYGA